MMHTRLAKIFTWLLLLAFVILPGTFSRAQNNQGPAVQPGEPPPARGTATKVIDEIANLPLYVLPLLPFASRF